MFNMPFFYSSASSACLWRQSVVIISFLLVLVIPEFSLAQSERGAERRSEQAERQAERRATRQAERQAERRAKRQTERQVERQAERLAEKKVERQVERQVEKQVGRQVAGQVQKRVGNRIEKQVGHQVQRRAENRGPRGKASGRKMKAAPPGLEKKFATAEKATGQERALEVRSENARADSTEDHADNPSGTDPSEEVTKRHHDIVREPDGAYRVRNQWLVITDVRSVARLENRGLKIMSKTRLAGLDQVLVELEGNPSDLPEDIQLSQADSGNDFNHLYQYQAASAASAKTADAWQPHDALSISRSAGPAVAIGLIDSEVNLDHDTLAMARIQSHSFIDQGLQAPRDHGTAIASILVGESSGFAGVLPWGEVYAGSVFYKTPELGQVASVKSLLLALDWMIRSNVKVINMSLAGPGNNVLKRALRSAMDKGIVIIAAAGNNGPSAPPVYPAAYEGVIAVTAVSKTMDAYYRANRGPYIDIAAPGVNIVHADNQNLISSSSGTSYAAPFVAAVFAQLLAKYSNMEAIHLILNSTLDLGESGTDDIYGSGFVQLPTKTLL